MGDYSQKKRYLLISITVLILICIIISLFTVMKQKESQKKNSDEVTASTEPSLTTEDRTGTFNEPDKIPSASEDRASTDEPSIYDSNMYFENEAKAGYGKKKVGSIIIEFKTDDAVSGNGNAAGTSVDAVSFHDGNSDNLKGYIFAVKAMMNQESIESVEEAKDCVSEYIPAGSGITSDWEETDSFFIRRATGYDNESDAAFLYYTIVPKNQYVDTCIYSAVYILDENGPVKESSYNSMSIPLSDYIPDSSFLIESYEDVYDELNLILNNWTSSEQELDGMRELRSASEQWYMDVYGVENEEEYNQLSEDEKADLYWRYKDPVGYSQVKEKEGGVPPKEKNIEPMETESFHEDIILDE